ncbi:MAG: cation:proton antiporter [Candidatus Woesearchaeota archaeon]
MAVDATAILTQLSILLLVGIVVSAAAHKLRVSNVLVLILTGLFFGSLADWFTLESTLLVGLGIVALAMVVFEGTTKFSLRQIDIYSGKGLELTAYQLLFVTLIVGVSSYFLLFSNVEAGILFALVLAFAVSGTDPSSVILLLPNQNTKRTKLLTIEAIINTPVMVLLPFIALDALTKTFTISQLIGIGQQLIVGVGTGVLIGLILFKAMRKTYAKDLSTAAIVGGALATYLIAQNLDGSGVLAVATLGIIFGNVTIKNKEELTDFSFGFSSIVEILVFLLIGILVASTLSFGWLELLYAAILFAGLFLARLLAVRIVLREETLRERIIVALLMPKGIAVAVLIFIFSSGLYPQIPDELITAMFFILLYSIAVATITSYAETTNES